MSKHKKKKNHPANPPATDEQVHLEDTLTEATDKVAKFGKEYRVPLIAGVVTIAAVFGLMSLFGSFSDQRNEHLNAQELAAFDEDRAEAAKKLPRHYQTVKGKPIEPTFAVKYAKWLWDDGTAEGRAKAISVLQESSSRHKNDPILEMALKTYGAAQTDDSAFEVPAPQTTPVDANASVEDANAAADSNAEAGKSDPVTPPAVTPPATTTPTTQPAGGNAKPAAETTATPAKPTTQPATPPATTQPAAPKPTSQPSGSGN